MIGAEAAYRHRTLVYACASASAEAVAVSPEGSEREFSNGVVLKVARAAVAVDHAA